jgi:uncharacterized protein (TIGR02996 family)
MADHENAFLAAIRAFPDDPGPRLVYADWLDERGRSAEAELLRVRVELARSFERLPQVRLDGRPDLRTDPDGGPAELRATAVSEELPEDLIGARVEGILPDGSVVRTFLLLRCVTELARDARPTFIWDLRSTGQPQFFSAEAATGRRLLEPAALDALRARERELKQSLADR